MTPYVTTAMITFLVLGVGLAFFGVNFFLGFVLGTLSTTIALIITEDLE